MENKPSYKEIQNRAYYIYLADKNKSDKQCWVEAKEELVGINNLSMKYLKDTWGDQTL